MSEREIICLILIDVVVVVVAVHICLHVNGQRLTLLMD